MERNYELVVMGCSAGGLSALRQVLGRLPADFPLPVLVVSHLSPDAPSLLPEILTRNCLLRVRECEEKDTVASGSIFVAPSGYHMLVERDHTLSLSVDPKVSNARPSIDVLFESAAEAYGASLIGVIMTGANSDGAMGSRMVREAGGSILVQDPLTAEADTMPRAALETAGADFIGSLDEIADRLMTIVGRTP